MPKIPTTVIQPKSLYVAVFNEYPFHKYLTINHLKNQKICKHLKCTIYK